MIVLTRVQDTIHITPFTSLPLRIILMVSACFYMDMNCFEPVRVVSSWLQVDSVAADNFGWVVADNFGWLRMVSVGFECFWVVCCFNSYALITFKEENYH